jgi:hypothetical protein
VPQSGQDLSPPLIQTPDYLANRAKRLHTSLLQLNAVLTAQTKAGRFPTGTPRYIEWKAFLSDFGRWYGGASFMWSADDATLEGYEVSFRQWEAWAKAAFPAAAADMPIAPPTFTPDKPDGASPLLIALALGAGVFVAYKVLR